MGMFLASAFLQAFCRQSVLVPLIHGKLH